MVTDRTGIERGIRVRSSYAVISISDPGSRRPKVRKQSGLRAVLRLCFHDAEPTGMPDLDRRVTCMHADQARQIWEFVTQHADVGTIVVHCEAGMSRSPAVAAALCEAMGMDDRFSREYQPNAHVYRLVLDAAPTRQTQPRPAGGTGPTSNAGSP
jgi:predicted protein tyrosine phosphatase